MIGLLVLGMLLPFGYAPVFLGLVCDMGCFWVIIGDGLKENV
jgi:hypothetical protein